MIVGIALIAIASIPSKSVTWESSENTTQAGVLPDVLLKIANCESGNKQFNEDGSVIRGVINKYDVGRFQINLLYHEAKAKELGYDLFTYEGNTNYAIWLYEHQGTKPWNWSRDVCWGKKQ